MDGATKCNPYRQSRRGHQVGDVSHFTEVIHEGLDCVGGQEPHHLLQGQLWIKLVCDGQKQ